MEIQVITNDSMKVIDGGKFTITDANGKNFDVTLSDIVDASTVAPADITLISDEAREKMLNFSPNITDSEGVTITDSELLDIVKSGEAVALDVTFEATHSGENLNHVVYTSSGLESDTTSWMFPFAKPLIKNHDMKEEPIGRVIDAAFGPSEFANDKDCINVTFRVSDTDAMTKFADGRYKTMSIGARSGYVRCNTCGKDILKDGKMKFCGHWKGEMYAGKKATWTVENMTFREGSVVNAPADVYAQVKNIKIVKKKREDNEMKDHTDANILDDMSAILDGQEPAKNDPTSISEPTPDQVPDTTKDGEGQGEKTDLELAQDKIAELEAKIITLTTDKEDLTTKLNEANDSLSAVTNDNETLKAEVETHKEKALKMAQFNLKLMKDNLTDLNPEISDAELEGKSAKEINDMLVEVRKDKPQRDFTAKVQNPGAPVKDRNDINDSEEENDKKQPEKVVTMKDMEDVVIGLWANKH